MDCDESGLVFDLDELRECISALKWRIEVLERADEERIKRAKRPSYVYMMIDQRNGRYKIGRSIDPCKRERTLQSEVPETELMGYCLEGRGISEKILHRRYKLRKVRGEWYNLLASEVKEVLSEMRERLMDSVG
jgi:hypothetical protein